MNYLPSQNDGKHVFVFGSNLGGYHGAGTAYQAKKNWGAVNGIGIGPQGNAYAIPTKDSRLEVLTLSEIETHVARFVAYAASIENQNLTFLVTAIGCGLSKYKPKDIAPMFRDAPENCVLPEEFIEVLKPSDTAPDSPSASP